MVVGQRTHEVSTMKILIIADTPLMPTGFSKVAHYIAMHLAKEYPIQGNNENNFTQGVFYQGKNALHIPLNFYGYQLLEGGFMADNSSAQLTSMFINKLRPDIILTLQDERSINYLSQVIKETNYKGKWICYYPLDMEFAAPYHQEFYKVPDVLVMMADFAYDMVKEWKDIKRIEKIWHGVNTEIYKPMPKDQELIKQHKLEKYKKIIGYVSNNQFRKMTYKSILAFSELRKKMEDVCLFMHTPQFAPEIGWPLGSPGVMEIFSVPKDVFFNPIADVKFKTGVNEDYLAKMFNMFDVQILLTGGEGFGLTVLEGLACGCPCIMTDWTTAKQLIGTKGERGFLVGIKDYILGLNVEYRAVPDQYDAAKKLEIILTDEKLRKKMSKNAVKFAQDYSWNKILPQWSKLIKSV